MVGYSLTSELRALSDLDEKAVYRTTTYTNAHNKRQLWEDVDTKYLLLWDSPRSLRIDQWCGLRPSVLGQDRSETKKSVLVLVLILHAVVLVLVLVLQVFCVLWNTILSRSSS